MLYNIIFLPIILFIGLASSYEDIKRGKIKNKLIVLGLIYGCIGYLFLIIFSFFPGEHSVVIKKVLLNTLISFVIGFMIWYLRLWAAADAKLFTVFSFIIPLKYYSGDQLMPFFPSFSLLINIFILVMLFLCIDVLYRLINLIFCYIKRYKIKDNFIKRIKENSSNFLQKIKKQKLVILRVIWGYICIYMFIMILREKLQNMLLHNIPINPIYISLILILLFRPLAAIFRRNNRFLFILTLILLVYFSFAMKRSSLDTILLMKRILINGRLFIFILFIFWILRYLIYKKEIIFINVDDLKASMIPSTEAMREIKQVSSLRFYPDGLTNTQAEEIKELYKKKELNAKLGISKTFPLAPFIFLGVLITLIKGNHLFVISFDLLRRMRLF